MPPRRSSRVASTSLEAPVDSLPIKRKRGQTIEPDNEEKENVAKPPSRTRRSVSARQSVPPPSRARRTRSKTTLPELPETEHEEHEEQSDSLPPVKKARSSVDNADDEEEMKLEEEDQAEAKSKRRKRGSSMAKSAVMNNDKDVPPTKRESSSKSIQESDDEMDEMPPVSKLEEDEEVIPIRKGRKAPTKRGSSVTTSAVDIQESDDEMDEMPPLSKLEEDEEVISTRKGRKAPTSRKAKVAAKKKSTKTTIIEDSDEDIQAPSFAQPRSQHNGAAEVASNPIPEVEEEEEKSLFDPLPMPEPSSLPQAIPEEPAGPKSRLVIHKMALINFKSYAGRQEIGPFHKVINIRQTTAMKADLFWSLQSFSSIVGPNGSGKSNTIDALLFVFGYRASKMRQGKISELIHNSANFPDLDECSVEVHFREIVDLACILSVFTLMHLLTLS